MLAAFGFEPVTADEVLYGLKRPKNELAIVVFQASPLTLTQQDFPQ
jgi:hypothetical protein